MDQINVNTSRLDQINVNTSIKTQVNIINPDPIKDKGLHQLHT